MSQPVASRPRAGVQDAVPETPDSCACLICRSGAEGAIQVFLRRLPPEEYEERTCCVEERDHQAGHETLKERIRTRYR